MVASKVQRAYIQLSIFLGFGKVDVFLCIANGHARVKFSKLGVEQRNATLMAAIST
jgi:hypothetical protein